MALFFYFIKFIFEKVKSPVYPNVVFPIHFTISNLTNVNRDLILLLPVRSSDVSPVIEYQRKFLPPKLSSLFISDQENQPHKIPLSITQDDDARSEGSVKSSPAEIMQDRDDKELKESKDAPTPVELRVSKDVSILDSLRISKEPEGEDQHGEKDVEEKSVMTDRSSEGDTDEFKHNESAELTNVSAMLVQEEVERDKKLKLDDEIVALHGPPIVPIEKTIHLG